MAGTSKLQAQWARCQTGTPSLNEGDGAALALTSACVLRTATALPAGSGTPKRQAVNGQPGRYSANVLSLNNGEGCALQFDQHNNLLIVQG